MEPSQALISNEPKEYPVIEWGNLGESGLIEALFILIERNEAIRNSLYPLKYDPRSGRKRAQCRELVKTIFAGKAKIKIHLQTPQGLEHYTELLLSRLRHFENSFVDVLVRSNNSDFDAPPDDDEIECICPSFRRLASILLEFTMTRRGIKYILVQNAVEEVSIEFESAVTLYDPLRAAAQIAAQDAVLRRLYQNPFKTNRLSTHASPSREGSNSSDHLPINTHLDNHQGAAAAYADLGWSASSCAWRGEQDEGSPRNETGGTKEAVCPRPRGNANPRYPGTRAATEKTHRIINLFHEGQPGLS